MKKKYLFAASIALAAIILISQRDAYSAGCPQWPDQSTRILTRGELKSCDCSQLELLRNEIYARHGRKFKRQDLKEHFESQAWYKFDPQNPNGDKNLNSFEKKNAGIIAGVERETGCKVDSAPKCPTWPAQSTRNLRDADLEFCDCRELDLLRNEIFARHGRVFARADLRKHFESKYWYRKDPNNPQGNKGLNAYEQKNAEFILNFEKSQGCKDEDQD